MALLFRLRALTVKIVAYINIHTICVRSQRMRCRFGHLVSVPRSLPLSCLVRNTFLAFAAVALFPLTSVAQLPVQGDANVNTAHASTNYGYLSNLYVGNGSTAYLLFD